jgi:tape measure domain-containing protein
MSNMNVGNIVYNVDVNTGKFVSGMGQVNKGLGQLDDEFKKADSSGQSFAGGLTKIAAALAALATIDALKGLQKMSEEFTLLRARIDRFSGGVRDGAANYERLLAISSKTGSDMGTAVKTWEALTGSLKEMGKSNTDILTLTDTLMKMGTLGGASAEEMKNGLRQLGQSFSGGIVRGEEFNSVLENTPEIARQLAKGLGIPFADLRKQMLDSKLTTEAVFEALLKRVDAVNTDFDKMPRTVAQAANAITNQFGSALSKLDKEAGFSTTLATAIDLVANKIGAFGADAQSVSDAIDMIGSAASSFAAIMAGRVLTSLGGVAIAQVTAIKNTLAMVGPQAAAANSALILARAEFDAAVAISSTAAAAAKSATGLQTHAALLNASAIAEERTTLAAVNLSAALSAQAGAATVASVGMKALSSAMAFLGGPTGVILLAAYALYEFSKASTQTKVDVDALNSSLDKLTFNQLAKASNDAGDDITKLNTKLSASMSELRTATKSVFESDTDFAKRKTELQAEKDSIDQQINSRRELQAAIKTQQDQLAKDQINKGNAGSVKPVHKTAAADQTVIDNLKEQNALAKLAGEARARLAAEQKLSAAATAEEKKQVGDLAVETYRLETAKKEAKKGDTKDAAQRKKDLTEEKRHTEDNAKAITDYAVSIGQAAMKGEDLARAQAQAKLNKFATPEDVATMDALAKAMYKVQQVEEDKQKLASVDPIAAEGQGFTDELKKLQELNDAKLLSDERYLELKAQATTAHEAQMRILQEENFKAASMGNAMLIDGVNALAAGATQSLSGILSGTSNLKDALGGIANTVLNTVVGAFVQMGANWVKQQIMMTMATKATEAAQIGGIAAVTTAQAGATGAIAATTTATAATTGTAVATSMAPAAGLSSIASFGGAAVIGGAALLGTMMLAKSFGGGRQYGGGVDGSKMYQVNETGKPEIFNAADGKQYMMPNKRGEVVSNADATAGGGGGGGGTVVNIHNYSGAQVSSSESQVDDNRVIDIVVGNMANGGKIAQMTNQITNTRRAGT